MTATITELEKPIPTYDDIDRLERRLESLKQIRERAKMQIIDNVDNLVRQGALQLEDLLKLQKIVSKRLALSHIKRRGSPVSRELLSNLDAALKLGEYSLGQLEKMFNLSVSYISRRKKELGLTHKREPIAQSA